MVTCLVGDLASNTKAYKFSKVVNFDSNRTYEYEE